MPARDLEITPLLLNLGVGHSIIIIQYNSCRLRFVIPIDHPSPLVSMLAVRPTRWLPRCRAFPLTINPRPGRKPTVCGRKTVLRKEASVFYLQSTRIASEPISDDSLEAALWYRVLTGGSVCVLSAAGLSSNKALESRQV